MMPHWQMEQRIQKEIFLFAYTLNGKSKWEKYTPHNAKRGRCKNWGQSLSSLDSLPIISSLQCLYICHIISFIVPFRIDVNGRGLTPSLSSPLRTKKRFLQRGYSSASYLFKKKKNVSLSCIHRLSYNVPCAMKHDRL